MKFINTHRKTVIVMITCLILIILAVFAIYRMFYPNSSKSVYGDRLANAPELDNAVIEKIKEDMMETNILNSVTYQTNGPILKFFMDTKKDTKVEDAKALTNMILDNFSTMILEFYDITVYIEQKEKEDALEFPIVGYHSKEAKEFTFVLNKAGDTDEK